LRPARRSNKALALRRDGAIEAFFYIGKPANVAIEQPGF
jgi:hypothetical protein